MSASLGLYRLQLVDSRMDEIRTRLEDIHKILENDKEMQRAQKQVHEADQFHEKTFRALKQAEAEVKQQKIKIEQSESRLYSGTIKNPKELQDLQNEVAALKRYLGTLEERQLETMLDEELAAEKKLAAFDNRDKVRESLAKQNQNLTAEQTDLNKELERFESERQAALSPLNDSLLAVYGKLREQKRGVAVAAISDGTCTACGTTLTPAQNQLARSPAEICNCPSCKRILFSN